MSLCFGNQYQKEKKMRIYFYNIAGGYKEHCHRKNNFDISLAAEMSGRFLFDSPQTATAFKLLSNKQDF